ncbi:MAG: AlpA family phage regulatory protein [Gammaproteobacteria bacterium]|nr:AlpA family phage regulatory protein [Gammaproteobacteria bacterium]
MSDQDRLLRRFDVEQRCGLARSTIYRLMGENRFPRPIRVGPKAVRWSLLEVEDWLATRPRNNAERTEAPRRRPAPSSRTAPRPARPPSPRRGR